jgi:hypothetical protein
LAETTGADGKFLKISGGRIIERQICSFYGAINFLEKVGGKTAQAAGVFVGFGCFPAFMLKSACSL